MSQQKDISNFRRKSSTIKNMIQFRFTPNSKLKSDIHIFSWEIQMIFFKKYIS